MAKIEWRLWLGHQRRRFARFDEIIAITGSVGKTSTTGMIGALMKTRGPTLVGQNFNDYRAIVLTLAKSWTRKAYWVQEVSGDAAGRVIKAAEFLRPSVTVITTIGTDHIDSYASQDDIAAEKAQLVSALPDTGLAVLNADEPLVLAMTSNCNCRVITYGVGKQAQIKATGWSDGLPGRLQITVSDGEQTRDIQTRLIDGRWITSILATIAVGRGLGIPLNDCARVLEELEPVLYRDSVHKMGDGTTFVLDTHKGAYWTVQSCIEIVDKATAPKKTIVLGNIRYYLGSDLNKYRNIVKKALKVADRVIIYCKQDETLQEWVSDNPDRLYYFSKIRELDAFLKKTGMPGELIYLKGAISANLERLWYERVKPIHCWVDECGKIKTCDRCDNLYGSRWNRF